MMSLGLIVHYSSGLIGEQSGIHGKRVREDEVKFEALLTLLAWASFLLFLFVRKGIERFCILLKSIFYAHCNKVHPCLK